MAIPMTSMTMEVAALSSTVVGNLKGVEDEEVDDEISEES